MHPASIFGHHEGLAHVTTRVRVRHGVIDQIHAGFSKCPQHGLGPLWFGIAMVPRARPRILRSTAGTPRLGPARSDCPRRRQIPYLGVRRAAGAPWRGATSATTISIRSIALWLSSRARQRSARARWSPSTTQTLNTPGRAGLFKSPISVKPALRGRVQELSRGTFLSRRKLAVLPRPRRPSEPRKREHGVLARISDLNSDSNMLLPLFSCMQRLCLVRQATTASKGSHGQFLSSAEPVSLLLSRLVAHPCDPPSSTPDFLPATDGPNHPAQAAPRSDAACRRSLAAHC